MNIEFTFDLDGAMYWRSHGSLAYICPEWDIPVLAHPRLCTFLAILDKMYVGLVCNNCFIHYREVSKTI